MKLHLGRPEPLDYETLISETPDQEFKNLTRSTIPLLAYWASPSERLASICHRLDIVVPYDMRLCFEYPVPSVGRAMASFTDIMGISDSICVAIEGKSTEDNYDSVKDWLAKGGSSRPPVLAHWLELIANKTGIKIHKTNFSTFDDVTYQMIHRTASACALDKPHTVVVYQIFDVKQKLPNYKEKLLGLATAIGAEGKIDILLNVIRTHRTKAYETTKKEIKSLEKKDVPQWVRNAILDGNLFQFDDGSWESISKAGIGCEFVCNRVP